MIAACQDNSDILRLLTSRGANLRAQNRWGGSVLTWAAEESFECLCHLLVTCDYGYDLGREDAVGVSALSLIVDSEDRRKILFILNFAPNPTAYQPQTTNVLTLAIRGETIDILLLKKLLRRLPRDLLSLILKHRSKTSSTPLYTACTRAPAFRQLDTIKLLLRAGAQLEYEGGDYGTPLMGACAAGRLSAVKLLVERGARLIYERDGITVSAIDAAKYFPEIVRWILVERFTQGPRLLLSHPI